MRIFYFFFCSECQVQLINMFGKSLQYGCEYIYQSMPRMLSTWLDFGTQLAQDTRKPRGVEGISERKAAMNKMTALVGEWLNTPIYHC